MSPLSWLVQPFYLKCFWTKREIRTAFVKLACIYYRIEVSDFYGNDMASFITRNYCVTEQ